MRFDLAPRSDGDTGVIFDNTAGGAPLANALEFSDLLARDGSVREPS
ncbi:MAG: hypothetical protein WDN24_01760 [Sphingomonas sp.]